MANQVTYNIDLIPENAEKIDQINQILLGGDYTASPKSATTAKEPSTKKSGGAAQKGTAEAAAPAASGTTLDAVKKAAKAAKAEHGEDFAMQVLKDAGVDVKTTLGRSMGVIAEDLYDTVIAGWEAGPQVTEQVSDEPDDDWGDDDEDGEAPTAEAVKTALKAYSKEVGRAEAKEIMTKHGAKALSEVDNCTPEQLKAMFAELV